MGKRPLFIVFLSLVSGMLIFKATLSNFTMGMFLIFLLLSTLAFLIFKKKYQMFFTILIPFLLSSFAFFINEWELSNLPNNTEIALTGRIISIENNSVLLDKVRIYVGDEKWKKIGAKVNIVFDYMNHQSEFLNLGSWTFARGSLKKKDRYPFLELHTNNRNFSFAPYFDSLSTRTLYAIGRLRKKYEEFLKEKSSNWDLIIALLFGRSPNSENKRLFSDSGLYHLFVVSGLHVNLLMSIIYLMTGFFITDLRFRCSISIILLTLYCLSVGYSFPSLRAVFMMDLVLLFKILDYPQDKFNVLGFSGILIFLFDPMSVLSISFQLSFIATLVFMSIFLKDQNNFLNSLKALLIATLGLAPFTILYFGKLYPLSSILSFLLVPTTIIPMILGSTMGFLTYTVNLVLLSQIFVKGVEPFANFIRFFTKILSKTHLVSLTISGDWKIILFYFMIFSTIALLSSSFRIFFKHSGHIP